MRKFVRITRNELNTKIYDATIDKYGKDVPFVDWRTLTPQIEKDLKKCEFDLENVEEGGNRRELMGYRTLDNGLTFLGILAGGDWEISVFFIIYWDGKKLRGYIPSDGNPWNKTTKKAYGNDDGEFSDGEDLKKRYSWFCDRDPRDIDYSEAPCRDFVAIRKDIEKRIVEK